MQMVEPIGLAPVGSVAMAIRLHNMDRYPTRSSLPSMFGIKQIPSLFRMAAATEGSLSLATWSINRQLPLRRRAALTTADGCACGLALIGDAAVCNEEAFHYLLEVERKRFEASSKPFALVLVHSVRRPGQSDKMPGVTAAKIFASLTRTLRDTDVIGWYRDHYVIGAVLTHLGDAPLADTTRQMSERVTRALTNELPGEITRHLKVRLRRPRARMTT